VSAREPERRSAESWRSESRSAAARGRHDLERATPEWDALEAWVRAQNRPSKRTKYINTIRENARAKKKEMRAEARRLGWAGRLRDVTAGLLAELRTTNQGAT